MEKPNDPRHNVVDEVLARTKISDVYREQTGITPRRTGRDTWRGSWPGGDSRDRISGDDSRGVWHDFVTDEGGGILDLVVRIRGVSREGALRLLAESAGVQVNDTVLTPADRARWAEERRDFERDLPLARLFQRGAILLCEGVLNATKSRYFDPTEIEPAYADCVALRDLTNLLVDLERMGDAAAVREFHWWRDRFPGHSGAIVRATKAREAAEVRALRSFLRQSAPEMATP
jgi:hypothetical protein